MVRHYLFLLLLAGFWHQSQAQSFAEQRTVFVSAEVQKSPAQITFTWELDPNATGHKVFRRLNSTGGWGLPLATLGATDSTYTDATAVLGENYEYAIEKQSSANPGISYLNGAIELPAVANKGIMILVVEDSIDFYLPNEVSQLEEDLKADSWFVTKILVNRADAASDVKTQILSAYNDNPGQTEAVFILGHVPVPYSGSMSPTPPDAHVPQHLGAWAADAYYGEMDGNWTDATVTETQGTHTRAHNIPGDGKFDQNQIPSDVDLQVGRVDFYDMAAFSDDEYELTRKYLEKDHKYKTSELKAVDRGLVDQGSFTGMSEGFAQNGFKNFSVMFGPDSVHELDFFSTLQGKSYMWAYGCGAGSYTSASGIGNTTNFASDSLEAVFTMMFGSYFGDWDHPNNLMKAALGSGNILSCAWAGRPNWMFHHMAMGENIGYSARLSQNNSTRYSVNAFGRFVHIALLGDPSLRMHYPESPSSLLVSNQNEQASLTWTASADPNVLGYHVYRRNMDSTTWQQLSVDFIAGTNYLDTSLDVGGDYEYMVRAVELRTTGSGSYYNQSLGVFASGSFAAGITDVAPSSVFRIAPNPNNGRFRLHITQRDKVNQLEVLDIHGRVVERVQVYEDVLTISLQNQSPGVYLVRASGEQYSETQTLILR